MGDAGCEGDCETVGGIAQREWEEEEGGGCYAGDGGDGAGGAGGEWGEDFRGA